MGSTSKVSIQSANSTNPNASAINGHEFNIPNRDDLQYACTFPLARPKVCAPGEFACDCSADVGGDTSALVASNSPVCQPPSGGIAGTTQYYAKAYPGARELTVLRDFGANAIVASICPKITVSANPNSDPNYGYNPAVAAIITHVKQALASKCLPSKLPLASDQRSTTCGVIEVEKTANCDCAAPGRSAMSDTKLS